MSLIVNHLTRIYGSQKAVNSISFSAGKGEIVGFLGPNGAGKSTTMKISTGYLSATEGQVLVEGFDVSTHPLEVKRITGYLPEHNPLYLDLFVHEYLQFAGGIYGLKGKALRNRVAEMIELCGLTGEQNKKIEALSKGYRQRVGLAQALIHDPQVLILDEPTSGLDPNQILEIRNVIRTISVNKTVVFSTHIMQEVQALCDRVVVINKGEIVADDRLDNLLTRQSAANVTFMEFENEVDIALLQTVPGVSKVAPMEKGASGTWRYRVTAHSGADLRSEMFRFAADNKLSLIGLRQEEASLETLFRELTLPGLPHP
jgi:ABC-2 type transport system ATP-binding protein